MAPSGFFIIVYLDKFFGEEISSKGLTVNVFSSINVIIELALIA
jgi:hypothetical protein